MTPTLLLTSAGMQVQQEIRKILPRTPGNIQIAHIITACNQLESAPWRDKDKQNMLDVGFQVTDVDIQVKNETHLRKILKDSDVIYVQGGDPYLLLKHVKLSGFDKVVKEYLKQGKIYIGVSAGSYIACPTMEMALWKKPKRSKHGLAGNETAMNLVPFLLSVHYEEKFRAMIQKGISSTRYPVKILTDDQAMLVKGNSYTLVGKGNEITLG